MAPLAAAAQPAGKVWRIGYLVAGTGRIPEAFRQELRDLGYVEGQNLAIEYRSAASQLDRLPDLAAELVRLPVDVLVVGGANAARVAQQVTRTIPIVLAAGGDPVGVGLVASLAQPGENITGLSFLGSELEGKRLELLKEAAPTASRVAALFNPASINAAHQWREMGGQPGRWGCSCTRWRCARPTSWSAPLPLLPARALARSSCCGIFSWRRTGPGFST